MTARVRNQSMTALRWQLSTNPSLRCALQLCKSKCSCNREATLVARAGRPAVSHIKTGVTLGALHCCHRRWCRHGGLNRGRRGGCYRSRCRATGRRRRACSSAGLCWVSRWHRRVPMHLQGICSQVRLLHQGCQHNSGVVAASYGLCPNHVTQYLGRCVQNHITCHGHTCRRRSRRRSCDWCRRRGGSTHMHGRRGIASNIKWIATAWRGSSCTRCGCRCCSLCERVGAGSGRACCCRCPERVPSRGGSRHSRGDRRHGKRVANRSASGDRGGGS